MNILGRIFDPVFFNEMNTFTHLEARLKEVISGRKFHFPTEIVIGKDGKTQIQIALAGVSKDRVKVSVKDGDLLIVTIEPSKDGVGKFAPKEQSIGTFSLLRPVADIKPVMKDGLLTITIEPQRPAEPDIKVVEIE